MLRRPWLLLLAFGVADAAPDAVVKKADPNPPAKLDDICVDASCKHHALDHFRSEFAKRKAGQGDRPLRVSYFGDSLTADDQIVGSLRERLAGQIGPGGPGFVFAQKPHPFNQHQQVQRWVSGSWAVHGISTSIIPDHLLGLGGDTEGSGTIKLIPTTPITTIDVHYLAQPGGGQLELVADGTVVQTVATVADKKTAAFAKIEVPATTKIELRARGRVRLFGASLEAGKGAVVDNLGVVNATAKGMVTFNSPDHLKTQLAHRGSDLVIVMFGTNEAEWLAPKGQGMAEHAKVMDELLTAIRAANPDASCLVISPLDQLDWRLENAPPRESIPAMVEIQHKAAAAHGCAFWDTYQWMGGRGASANWFRRGLVVKDFQHPTTQGALKIAAALFEGLVR